MAKDKKNPATAAAVANANPASANPASAVKAVAAEAVEKKPKLARKQAEALLTAGILTQEEFDRIDKMGGMTSGEGGGLSIEQQMKDAGADPADVSALFETLKKISEKIKGKKDAEGREIIGVAAWVKHKSDKKADEAKPADQQ